MAEAKDTMVQYIEKLTATEMQICCEVVRTHAHSSYSNVHPGVLPFIPIRVVIASLKYRMSGAIPSKRIYAKLLSVLEAHKWMDLGGNYHQQAKMLRELNDGLVGKRFGSHPERGVVIPNLAPVKRLRERKRFEAKKDAYDMIQPMMKLRRLDVNYWEVTCDDRLRHHVDFYLLDACTGAANGKVKR